MGISMGLADWLTFIGVFSTAVFSPGPDFLAVLRTSLKYGRLAGVAVAAGISMGTLFWSIATLGGILAILNTNPHFTRILQLFGAIALACYGIHILYSIYWKTSVTNTDPAGKEKSLYRFLDGFKLGLFTNVVSNPKAVIFFSVIFVSLLPANISLIEASLVTTYMVIFPFLWFCLVAVLASGRLFISVYQRAGKIIDTLLGLLFVILGILLLI